MAFQLPIEIQPAQIGTDKYSDRKHYTKPKIIHEFELETRAGSPIPGGFDPLDPSSWGSSGP
jgi:hypothetical protein